MYDALEALIKARSVGVSVATQNWKSPPFIAGRILFFIAEALSLIGWLTASTQTGSDMGAVFFWLVVPYFALMIFTMHHAQLEKRYAPAQYIYRRRFHIVLFILLLPMIISTIHSILGTGGGGSSNGSDNF